MSKYARKIDGNHNEVVDYLESNGVAVLDCSRMGEIPDLLCQYRNEVAAFLEVKMPGSQAKWTRSQLLWLSNTRFSVGIVKSGENALETLVNRIFLSRRQKDSIASMLIMDKRDNYTPAMVEKHLA